MMAPITWDRGIGSYNTATILYNTSASTTATTNMYDTWTTVGPGTITWNTNKYTTDNYTTDNYTWSTASDVWLHNDDSHIWTIKHQAWYTSKPKTAQEKLQEIIQARHTPAIHTKRQGISVSADPREIKAHDTLQLLIGHQRYRQYLKNGYVTIHNRQNGKTYQVYPGTKFTHVYDHGQREPDLCIYLAHDFPPTDQLIAKILLIQTDPNHYHRIANKHQPRPQTILAPTTASNLSLPEIYKELKKARVA
jgi:hypothetical protein